MGALLQTGASAYPGLVMKGSYNCGLVVLSVAIAVLASYAALDLANAHEGSEVKAET